MTSNRSFWSAATSAVTEDLEEDEAATVFSDGGVVAPEGSTQLQRTGSINDLDYLLDEVSQEEAEGNLQSQLQQQEGPAGTSGMATKSPAVKKCQEWILSSPSSAPAASSKSSPVNTAHSSIMDDTNDICIQKLSAMLRDCIRSRNTSSPYNNNQDEDDDNSWLHRKVPSPMSPLSQLSADLAHNLPAGLMSIVTVLTGSLDDQETDHSKCVRRSFMQILAGAVDSSKSDLQITSNPEILTSTLLEFFGPFKISLKSNTRMNKALSEAVETYVNRCLESAKCDNELHSRYGWIKLSNSQIDNVIRKTNIEKFLNLSPERLAKYASRLQAFIWENVIQRCLKVIKSLVGVDLFNLTNSHEYDEPSSLVIESQESDILAPEDPLSQLSQSSLSCIPEEELISAVRQIEEANEGDGDDEDDNGSDTQRSDDSVEYLRSTSDFSSQPESLNLSQNSLPRRSRSPDEPVASPDPGSSQLNGFANETYFNFGGGGSQSSSDGSDNNDGPTRKFRRLN